MQTQSMPIFKRNYRPVLRRILLNRWGMRGNPVERIIDMVQGLR